MKKELFRAVSVVLGCVFVVSLAWAAPQGNKDIEKIIGDWSMEVDAGGVYYYLSFTIKEESGALLGTISEESGSFTDAKMEKIVFDGLKLQFEMAIPTPPDGVENLVQGEFEHKEGKLEGILSIEEFGMTAYATCTKKK